LTAIVLIIILVTKLNVMAEVVEMKRGRSPNYPSIGLSQALPMVNKLYQRNVHLHAVPRESIAKFLGYAGLNGASASIISALIKFGLLIKSSEEDLKLSERAMSLVAARNVEEHAGALMDAFRSATLFEEMLPEFPLDGPVPEDEALRVYLIRKGFIESAIPQVIQSFRDSFELVRREANGYSQGTEKGDRGAADVSDQSRAALAQTLTKPRSEGPKLMDGERELTTGLLSKTASFRLIVRGEVGQKEIERLIAKLELDKEILADEPIVKEPKSEAPLGEVDDNAE
jgi:hypothetical protein